MVKSNDQLTARTIDNCHLSDPYIQKRRCKTDFFVQHNSWPVRPPGTATALNQDGDLVGFEWLNPGAFISGTGVVF